MSFRVPEDRSSSCSDTSYTSLPNSETDMSQPTNQGDTNPAEMAQQILSALTKKRETKWLEWDSMAQNLRSFLFELRVKIEEDRNLLGTD